MRGTPIDETGKTYGRLFVEGRYPHTVRGPDGKARPFYWVCRCSCKGVTGYPGWKRVRGDALRGGYTKSCGCLLKEMNQGLGVKIETPGTVYGLLTVTGPAGKVRGRPGWLCDCACGTKDIAFPGHWLRDGRVKSCGPKCTERKKKCRESRTRIRESRSNPEPSSDT